MACCIDGNNLIQVGDSIDVANMSGIARMSSLYGIGCIFRKKYITGIKRHSIFVSKTVMSKSDFLPWDAVDLEYLLGDYTEYSSESDISDGEYDDVDSGKPAKRCKTDKSLTTQQPITSSKTQYICPICEKSLKTISGFRGHTSKQHGVSNLKGIDYKVFSFQ